MKNNLHFVLLFVAVFLSSCSQLYNYVQVFEAQSPTVNNQGGGMVYEDDNCVIYYAFWAKGGDASFSIYNKTDEVMSVNPCKSFFIRNKIVTDYYEGQPVIAIPPHAYRVITKSTILDDLLLDCDLDRYPEASASITYEESNSPLQFTNYITYRLGEAEQEKVIENNFYIARITNYARHLVYKFVERPKRPCQNMTSDDSRNYNDTYPTKVYDSSYTFDISNCFYLEYQKISNRKLYKDNSQKFYYNEMYGGYTTSGSDTESDYMQRLLHPFAKP